MVRHEAAEALGALWFNQDTEAGRAAMDACHSLLKRFSDPQFERDVAVRESCEVALDATDYWATATQPRGPSCEVNGFAQQKAAFDRLGSTAGHFNIREIDDATGVCQLPTR